MGFVYFVAWFSPVVTGFRAPGLSRPELKQKKVGGGREKEEREGGEGGCSEQYCVQKIGNIPKGSSGV